MIKLEKELNIIIPDSIKKYIKDLDYHIDDIGKSNSIVVIYDDYILKISRLSFDILNEERIYNALKDKLPIPKLIESVVTDNRIFLLKEKLKGKMLSDSYYMERPDLLYSLAIKALKMLWSVDISNLDLQDTYQTAIDFGRDAYNKGLIKFENADRIVTDNFNSFEEVFEYLENNKPEGDKVLTHGDLCIVNIICDEDKIVGFIDLGLMGISNRYHDIAILFRSIRNNSNGMYGRKYDGFPDNKLFELLNIPKNDELIKYYLVLDEVLG